MNVSRNMQRNEVVTGINVSESLQKIFIETAMQLLTDNLITQIKFLFCLHI